MQLVGVQKEKEFFRLAYLSTLNGAIRITCLEKKSDLSQLKKETWTVTGIEGQDLLMRHLSCPLKTIRSVQSALPFQLETLVPHPLKKVVLKPIYFVKDTGTDVLTFVIPKTSISSHIARFHKDKIDPEWISVVPMALFRFASFVCPDEKRLIVLYVGIERIQLISIADGNLTNHITLSIGAQDLDDPNCTKMVSQLKKEVDRALCFLLRTKTQEAQKILFCGEKAKEIEALLTKEQTFSLRSVSVKKHPLFDRDTLSLYAIPIGLGIDILKNDRWTVQLRQGEFVSKKSFSFLKKGLIQGGILALALFVFGFFSIELLYHKKAKRWIQCLDQVVARSEKGISTLSGGLQGNSLEKKLADLNLRLRIAKNGGGLFSKPPLVSDLLRFLSSHPKLRDVEIRQIDYVLREYPSLLRPKDAFRLEVRLVLFCKEPQKALAFRDAILEDETMVDHDKQVEWKRIKDEYEIGFSIRHLL